MAFSLFKKEPLQLLSEQEKEQVVNAIRLAESRTSGEIRVYMESHCKYVSAIDRAAEIFFNLQMDKTSDRNAVLLYIAVKDHQMAIFGDEGIYSKTGKSYWENLVNRILQHFNKDDFAAGISEYIHEIGEGLHAFFPYNSVTDHNELPDDIVFGN
ncbi:MAG: TPM domain-containing protein [Niabella sp.]